MRWAITSLFGLTMPNNVERRVAPVGRADRELRNVDATIDISAIPVKQSIDACKTQFADGWDVKRFEVMLLIGHNTSLADGKSVGCDMDIVG